MLPLTNILFTYQQKLRLTFLQACLWVLLFALFITVSRLFGDSRWTDLLKLMTYISGAAVLIYSLHRLRTDPVAEFVQRLAIGALFLCATVYMFASPQDELLVGTVAFAAILFNCVVAEEKRAILYWYVVSATLYLSALLLRNLFPMLHLTYHMELIISIYLLPIILGWGCYSFGQRIIQYLAEILHTSKNLQDDLKQRELQYEQLLQTMNEGFTILEASSGFVYVNDKFCEIFGYSRDELLAMQDDPATMACNLRILQTKIAQNTQENRFSFELSTERRNGTLIHLLVSAMPQLENGEQQRTSCVVMDITERKVAEDELMTERALLSERVEERTQSLHAATNALQKELQERKRSEEEQARLIEQLAKAARLKDEFLASMSHELRTPLNSILGMSEALQDKIYGELTERQLKALGTIETSGRHLLALINDILDLAKIESGQIDLSHDAVDVVAVCDSCVRLIQPVAQKKEQTVHMELDPDVKLMVADGRRVKQLLINLLSNAQKFTPNGGSIGLIVHPLSETKLGTETETEAKLEFIVWDTGVGISDESMTHLFEPFVQVDSSLSRSYEGTGLGLALVKGVAELHNGNVRVESQLGKGSRFIVTLPWIVPELAIEHRNESASIAEAIW